MKNTLPTQGGPQQALDPADSVHDHLLRVPFEQNGTVVGPEQDALNGTRGAGCEACPSICGSASEGQNQLRRQSMWKRIHRHSLAQCERLTLEVLARDGAAQPANTRGSWLVPETPEDTSPTQVSLNSLKEGLHVFCVGPARDEH